MKIEPQRRVQLWQQYAAQGKKLKDWSWEWRVGWVKTCDAAQYAYCQTVLYQGLMDKAAVVRSIAANQVGRQYAGSQNRQVIRILAAAAANQANFRRGQPLFVQKRILFAMYRVGGDLALETAQEIASRSNDLAAYWQRVAKS